MNQSLAKSAINAAPPALIPRFITADCNAGTIKPVSAAQELTAGLLAPCAFISPKFFYDPLGSKLFEAITALDEYYPTRTEAVIFDKCFPDLAASLTSTGILRPCLIDLGAGNCAKAASLIPHLNPVQYVPVDISVDFLKDAAAQVQASFPQLDIIGLGMDFSTALTLPDNVQNHDRVFFYPGSSLGNFSPEQSLKFLRRLTDTHQGNARGLLLGIDLVKDTRTLEAAYDDALGVTAAFNKNVLRHVNALLGSDFEPRQWRHVALFNRSASRIEMHLEATDTAVVRWPGHQRSFAAGDRIHTESSYKYTVEDMRVLLEKAGFSTVRHWSDDRGWFGVFWAEV